jgi:hypothetical protein
MEADYRKERKLLMYLYGASENLHDAKDLMPNCLDKGKSDPHYELIKNQCETIEVLIKRLETYLQTNQDLL